MIGKLALHGLGTNDRGQLITATPPCLLRRNLVGYLICAPFLLPISCGSARALTFADMGAVGDGVTDDTAAIAKALRSGRLVDGQGRTYVVRGNIMVAGRFAGLSNATFVQKAPPTLDRRTITIRNSNGFAITNVTLRQGIEVIALSTHSMMERGGLFIQNCSDFTLDHVAIRGGGCGTSLVLQFCTSFSASDISIADVRGIAASMPSDDVLQGFMVQQSNNFRIIRPRIELLTLKIGDRIIAGQSRALVIGGSSQFEIVDLFVRSVGQGLDLTGGDGNHDFKIIGGRARDCGTWGFKFANSARNGIIENAVAENCGLGGFVASGPAEKIATPPTQSIIFRRCQAKGIGGSWRLAGTFGFGIMENSRTAPGYPRAIRFEQCMADGGDGGEMMTGFRNDLPDLAGADRNIATGCSVTRYTEHAFVGFTEG